MMDKTDKIIVEPIYHDNRVSLLPDEIFEDVICMLCNRISITCEYEKGHLSNSYYEPDIPPDLNVEVHGVLPFSDLKEKYLLTKKFIDAIVDSFENIDFQYGDLKQYLISSVGDLLPDGFSQTSVYVGIDIKKVNGKSAFVLDYEIVDYIFDEHTYIDSFRDNF